MNKPNTLNSPTVLDGAGDATPLLISMFSSMPVGLTGDPFVDVSSDATLVQRGTDYLEVDPSKTDNVV